MSKAWVLRAARALAFCATAWLAAQSAEAAPRVRVASGALEGQALDGVERFLGIPYAAPPTGALRWRAPDAAPSWHDVRAATEYGASCMQAPRPPWGPYTREYVEQAKPPSEDCLTLNVWRPAARRERLPILVWIHGGAFIGGASSVPIYDGAALARTGIIVVSINYRLGTFGFFAADERGASNFGILDTIAALRWLRANAASFGGDPRRITIAGQSAGAAMVNLLLVSEDARGLFAGAISQSMPLGGVLMRSRAEATASRDLFLRAFEANSVDALRAVSAERILEATQLITPGPMAPIVDGVTLADDPLALAQSGRVHPVALMAGVVADESTLQGGLLGYRTVFANRYGASAARFLELYPATDDATARAAARLSNRDRLMMGLRQWTERRPARAGGVYLYVFQHVEPGPSAETFGAFHTSEIPYAFATLAAAGERTFTDADRAIEARMNAYWSTFVKRGDPNATGLPRWSAATPTGAIMGLGESWAPIEGPEIARTDFFRAYFEQGGRASLF